MIPSTPTVLAACIVFASPALAQDPRFDALANLPFQQGYPTEEMAQRTSHAPT
jgi:hypothetical protein